MEWQAYFRLWPSGEEAMDLRFEALRMDMAGHAGWTQYVINRSAGGKRPTPKQTSLDDCKIFNRLGYKKRARYFDEMTPEEVAKRMRSVSAGIRTAKGAKP